MEEDRSNLKILYEKDCAAIEDLGEGISLFKIQE
jgi:hypothetical protein